MKGTGSVDLQSSRRRRKPVLTAEDLQGVKQLIIAQPDITIYEIIERQGLSVSNETVRNKRSNDSRCVVLKFSLIISLTRVILGNIG